MRWFYGLRARGGWPQFMLTPEALSSRRIQWQHRRLGLAFAVAGFGFFWVGLNGLFGRTVSPNWGLPVVATIVLNWFLGICDSLFHPQDMGLQPNLSSAFLETRSFKVWSHVERWGLLVLALACVLGTLHLARWDSLPLFVMWIMMIGLALGPGVLMVMNPRRFAGLFKVDEARLADPRFLLRTRVTGVIFCCMVLWSGWLFFRSMLKH